MELPVRVTFERRPEEVMEQIDSCLGESFRMEERSMKAPGLGASLVCSVSIPGVAAAGHRMGKVVENTLRCWIYQRTQQKPNGFDALGTLTAYVVDERSNNGFPWLSTAVNSILPEEHMVPLPR